MKATNKCKVHKSFVGEVCPVCLYEELQNVKDICKQIYIGFTEGIFGSLPNGNTHQGIDEGIVLGDKWRNEILKAIVIAVPDLKNEINSWWGWVEKELDE